MRSLLFSAKNIEFWVCFLFKLFYSVWMDQFFHSISLGLCVFEVLLTKLNLDLNCDC